MMHHLNPIAFFFPYAFLTVKIKNQVISCIRKIKSDQNDPSGMARPWKYGAGELMSDSGQRGLRFLIDNTGHV